MVELSDEAADCVTVTALCTLAVGRKTYNRFLHQHTNTACQVAF